jgi:uncharacterized protein (DUF952 family)
VNNTLSDGASILHIATVADWEKLEETESYVPASFQEEGFIHASLSHQIAGVVDRYYAGRSDLILLVIQTDLLDAEIRFEDLTGTGECFPHIYEAVPTSAVMVAEPLTPGPAGGFQMPDAAAQALSNR